MVINELDLAFGGGGGGGGYAVWYDKTSIKSQHAQVLHWYSLFRPRFLSYISESQETDIV